MASAGTLPGYWQVLSATFDAGQGPNEAHLSGGDSGGAVFIMDGSTWELAGINYAVDDPYSLTPGGSSFIAAMYNQTGLYDRVSGDPLTRARFLLRKPHLELPRLDRHHSRCA